MRSHERQAEDDQIQSGQIDIEQGKDECEECDDGEHEESPLLGRLLDDGR